MKTATFFILFLFLSFYKSYAQEKLLFETEREESFVVKFNPAYSTATLPNYFIDKIAADLSKMRTYTKVSYHFRLHIKAVKSQDAKQQIFFQLKDISYSGNYKYRDFDFSHLIAPDTLEIYAHTNPGHEEIDIRIAFRNNATKKIAASIGVYDTILSPEIITENIKLRYSESQKQRFDNAIRNIDRYYRDAEKLKEIKKRILALNMSRADVVALRNVDLKYIEKDFRKIHPGSYKEALNLHAFDPEGVLQRYDSVETIIRQKRAQMNQKMSSLEEIYYKQALVELENQNDKEAVELLNKAIEVNPYFTKAQFRLALMDFAKEDYMACFEKISRLLNQMKPDSGAVSQAVNLGKQAFDSTLNICRRLNKEERYNQAIGILYKTQTFCDSTHHIDCDNRLQENIQTAVTGLYDSYLSIARASLKRGRTDMCMSYLQMADDYKKKNNEILKNNFAEENAIVLDLTDSLVRQSERENRLGHFEKANALLQQAKTFCERSKSTGCMAIINKKEARLHQEKYNELIYQSIALSKQGKGKESKEMLSLAMTYQQLHPEYIRSSIGTDTIEGKVRYIMYREAIENGKTALAQEQFLDALTEFDNARELEKQYVFKKDTQLLSLQQQAAEPLILDSLKKAQLKAWGKFYTEAYRLLQSSEKMIADYKLSNDREIQENISELKRQLVKSVCERKSREYRKLIVRANKSEDFEDFYHAALFWQQALNYAKASPDCILDTVQPASKLRKYHDDIRLAVYLHKTDSCLNKNTDAAFQYLLKATETGQSPDAKLHSRRKTDIFHLLLSYDNAHLNAKAIEYFIENKDIKNTYRLITHCLKSGQEIAPELQQKAACLIAESDRKSTQNPKEKAEERFGNSPEMFYVKKAYLRCVKK